MKSRGWSGDEFSEPNLRETRIIATNAPLQLREVD